MASKNSAPASAAAERLAAFDRWFDRFGHWMYETREQALDQWKRFGIHGLPRYIPTKEDAK